MKFFGDHEELEATVAGLQEILRVRISCFVASWAPSWHNELVPSLARGKAKDQISRTVLESSHSIMASVSNIVEWFQHVPSF